MATKKSATRKRTGAKSPRAPKNPLARFPHLFVCKDDAASIDTSEGTTDSLSAYGTVLGFEDERGSYQREVVEYAPVRVGTIKKTIELV